jgi:hypothetical protein
MEAGARIDWEVGEVGEHATYGKVRVLAAKTVQHLIVEQVYQEAPRTRRQVGSAELRAPRTCPHGGDPAACRDCS